ncbi:uncharacterized protein [Amphiura filiformis]|uniref:uncharacterized protein n=1 Tax=Amphiura filiformis TaxID=82378 RepID=UPI003B228562
METETEVTETWLDSTIDSNEFTPDEYLCFRKDRRLDFYAERTYTEEGRGGSMRLSENLNPILYTKGDADAEVVWCKVFLNPKTELLIGVVYRPERGGEPNLIKICNSINAIDSDNTIILGDFNFREINWTQCEAPSALGKKFLSCVEDNLLFQLVKKPTRVDVGEKLGASDHRSVSVQLRIPVPRIALTDRKVYLYSKGDYDAYSETVKATDWESIFAKKNFDDKWSILQSKYDEWRDKFIPSKLVKTGQRHKPPWSNYRSVRHAKKMKRAAEVKAKKTGLNVHREQFNAAKTNVDSTVRKAKLDYESALVDQIKTEPKKFYNYARHFTRSSATVEVLEHEGRKVTGDDSEKAEIFLAI